jgi:hypothetical protein
MKLSTELESPSTSDVAIQEVACLFACTVIRVVMARVVMAQIAA